MDNIELTEDELVLDRHISSSGLTCGQINKKLSDINSKWKICTGTCIYLYADDEKNKILDIGGLRNRDLKLLSNLINKAIRRR